MGAYVNGVLVPPVDAQSLDGLTANFGTPGAPEDGYAVTYESNTNELVLTNIPTVTVPWTSAAAPVETRTTDATWTTIATATLAQSSCVTFVGAVSAIRDDGTEGGSWTFTARARRPAAGVPVMGTVLFGLTDSDDATWDVRVQVSGSDVVVQVMGAVGKTVTWRAEVQTTEAKV